MKPMIGRWLDNAFIIAVLVFCLSGCYYMQAARGQLEVMRKREPISEVVESHETEPALAERLRLVDDARQFSIDVLALPDNGSYRSYSDLERDFVVWNVIAAPEFSLQPKRWCYPVVGCVSYRGYFSDKKARRLANRLIEDGYDVTFGGVAAYSTLGRFNDPILNTMMHWDDIDLVAVMFHELAHQVLYIKDDSGFNESFATAVEEFGIERWLAVRDQESDLAEYRKRRELKEQMMAAIAVAREDLEAIYASGAAAADMRASKSARLDMLIAEITTMYRTVGREPPSWLDSNVNNARLVSMTLYHGRLPEFRALFADCHDDIRCFYQKAEELSKRL